MFSLPRWPLTTKAICEQTVLLIDEREQNMRSTGIYSLYGDGWFRWRYLGATYIKIEKRVEYQRWSNLMTECYTTRSISLFGFGFAFTIRSKHFADNGRKPEYQP